MGRGLLESLARHSLARLVLVGTEDGLERGYARLANPDFRRLEARCDFRVLIGRRISPKSRKQFVNVRIRKDVGHKGDHRLLVGLRNSEHVLQRESFGLGPVGAPVVIGDHARHLGTLGEHRVDDFAEIELARNRDDARERLTERTLAVFGRAREHGIERLPAELCLSLLVEHREMRRDLSLEREAL